MTSDLINSLRTLANTRRQDITSSRDNVNTAVWDLYNARDPRTMARAFLTDDLLVDAVHGRPSPS
ncbi:hypothetical protein ABZ517_19320 [Streptomyces scabiei]|uniref:hypothetical protein n=1 Tax=Streptomyces scabiei TaxID=1930 RepID=UPI0033E6A652